jgi:hypothetical protein
VPRLTMSAHPLELTREGGIRVTGEANQHRHIDAFC